MDIEEIRPLLFWGAGLSGLMALYWFSQFKKVAKAKAMAPAFAAMGVLMSGFGLEWPVLILVALGVVVFGLLVLDFVLRSAERAKREETQ